MTDIIKSILLNKYLHQNFCMLSFYDKKKEVTDPLLQTTNFIGIHQYTRCISVYSV